MKLDSAACLKIEGEAVDGQGKDLRRVLDVVAGSPILLRLAVAAFILRGPRQLHRL